MACKRCDGTGWLLVTESHSHHRNPANVTEHGDITKCDRHDDCVIVTFDVEAAARCVCVIDVEAVAVGSEVTPEESPTDPWWNR